MMILIILFLLRSINLFTVEVKPEESEFLINSSRVIKCKETTGTGKSDIFRIKNPEFEWLYKKKWYKISGFKANITDWDVKFENDRIKLFNKKTEWSRIIDLKRMTASMLFSSGEKYLYFCHKID